MLLTLLQVFGGYASEAWIPHPHFRGTGESFVFQLTPSFAVYPWTGANEFFMLASKSYIGMGGGYGYSPSKHVSPQ